MLFGDFNRENVALAYAITNGVGVADPAITTALANFPGVPGRMQLHTLCNGARAFVDYAHNALALRAVLAQVRGRMVAQGMGKILVLSSVAAIRTRKANYTYGAGKMGLDGFALGLADSVRGTGVTVQIARPGFVTSRMTAHLKPIPFSTTPDVAADKIVSGLSGKATVLWSPGILRVVFAIFRIVPPMLWRKMPA